MAASGKKRHILILRHAKSDWSGGISTDFDRPLNGRGRRAAAAMGAYLADECPVPSVVLCSAARRAAETWSIIARQWPAAPDAIIDRDLYLAETDVLLQRLRLQNDDTDTICLVGHHPGFDGLAIALASNADDDAVSEMKAKFPTASLALLEFEGDWASLDYRGARLVRFVRPKDIV